MKYTRDQIVEAYQKLLRQTQPTLTDDENLLSAESQADNDPDGAKIFAATTETQPAAAKDGTTAPTGTAPVDTTTPAFRNAQALGPVGTQPRAQGDYPASRDINVTVIVGRVSFIRGVVNENGNPGFSFQLAFNNDWTDRQTGQVHKQANYVQVTEWGENRVKALQNYLYKGQLVCVQGSLRYREWNQNVSVQSAEGEIVLGWEGAPVQQKHSTVGITATSVQFLSRKSSANPVVQQAERFVGTESEPKTEPKPESEAAPAATVQ